MGLDEVKTGPFLFAYMPHATHSKIACAHSPLAWGGEDTTPPPFCCDAPPASPDYTTSLKHYGCSSACKTPVVSNSLKHDVAVVCVPFPHFFLPVQTTLNSWTCSVGNSGTG